MNRRNILKGFIGLLGTVIVTPLVKAIGTKPRPEHYRTFYTPNEKYVVTKVFTATATDSGTIEGRYGHQIYLNGVLQREGMDYTRNGDTVRFSSFIDFDDIQVIDTDAKAK